MEEDPSVSAGEHAEPNPGARREEPGERDQPREHDGPDDRDETQAHDEPGDGGEPREHEEPAQEREPSRLYREPNGPDDRDETQAHDEPAEEREPSRLYREPNDRRVAGVCAGLADYVGVEPRLLRIATIVLAVLSPITVITYGLAALSIPQRPPSVPRTRASRPGGGSQQAWIAVTLMVGLAIGLALGTWTWWGLDVPLAALTLIALGVWWLVRGRTTTEENYLSLGVDITTNSDQSVHQDNRPVGGPAGGRDRVGQQGTYAPPAEQEEGAGPPRGVPPLPPPEWSGPAGGIDSRGPSVLRRLRGWRRWRPGHLGLLVIALLLIGWGTVWLLRVLDVASVGPRTAIATGLLAAGAALVLASWRGRAGLLIPLGLLAVAVLAGGEIVDIPLDAGIGDRTIAVDRPSQLDRSHELLLGDLTLDLRDAPLARSNTTFVSAGVGVGTLRVRVPPDANVVVRSDVRFGSVGGDLPRDGGDSGVLVQSTERLDGDADGPRLDLGLDVGIGDVEVIRG